MKVKNISLSWFRGAGRAIDLDTDMKNVVVYGANGAGKSNFADALEYIIGEGKVKHLIHKNIGSKQEKGIVNTHKPKDCDSTATIIFDGGIQVYVQIKQDGELIFGSEPKEIINFVQTWQLERLLLRQDEVAKFIVDTPGGKYSVLLPLLGLDDLERAADNTTKLHKSISEISKLGINKGVIILLRQEVDKYFTDTSDVELLKVLKIISENYGIKIKLTEDVFEIAKKLHQSIMVKFDSISPTISIHTTFNRIFEEDLPSKLSTALKRENEIKDKIDELLDIRIEILQKAASYNKNVEKGTIDILCPACGRGIRKEDFERHVNTELKKLQQLCSARDQTIKARQNLKESVSRVLAYTNDHYFKDWLAQEPQKKLKESLISLTEINLEKLQERFTSETQVTLSSIIPVINEAVKVGIEKEPPSNKKLLEDIDVIKAINNLPEIRKLEKHITVTTQILEALENSTLKIRETIKEKTEGMISQISKDIQYLWSKLHPNEPIEDVKLYIPEDEDKSIDVGLKFYGVDQPSPRFTLSEGHRNSLGLCIFLALARLEKNKHLPIFLDDIVSSLDRGHRGNVTELLKGEFGDRQILLFTHDREWFTELSMLLPPKNWKKLVLKPWNNPSIGMQWSTSEFTFDDAREYIESNCELAGNCVRQIMDARMAIAAEKLNIKMPYARGDKNDHRTCVEFLEYIISAAKRSLKKKDGTEWVQYSEPIRYWQDARDRLIVRADRGSHTGSLVKDEVENLISVCEASIKAFKCDACGDFIWVAHQENKEFLQCTCGNIRWKYD
jgi:energy-coupling factor transporter ATP-binding protein EcfA2